MFLSLTGYYFFLLHIYESPLSSLRSLKVFLCFLKCLCVFLAPFVFLFWCLCFMLEICCCSFHAGGRTWKADLSRGSECVCGGLSTVRLFDGDEAACGYSAQDPRVWPPLGTFSSCPASWRGISALGQGLGWLPQSWLPGWGRPGVCSVHRPRSTCPPGGFLTPVSCSPFPVDTDLLHCSQGLRSLPLMSHAFGYGQM